MLKILRIDVQYISFSRVLQDQCSNSLCTGLVVLVFSSNNVDSVKFAREFLQNRFAHPDGLQLPGFQSLILVANKADSRPRKEAEDIKNGERNTVDPR